VQKRQNLVKFEKVLPELPPTETHYFQKKKLIFALLEFGENSCVLPFIIGICKLFSSTFSK